ncbi:MAG: hypothetical protein PHV32_15490 [Eubacteriales bacterium]|nr:hypothetical protein [Eubacteriales bacterium]
MKERTSQTRRKRPPLECPHCEYRIADNVVKQKKLDKKIILKEDDGDIVVKCGNCGHQIGITIE